MDVDLHTYVKRHGSLVIIVAAVVPLVVSAVLALVRGSLTNTTAALVLVLVVVVAASTGVRAAGIVAALSSGLWFDIWLTRPYGQVAISERRDIEATVLLVIIGAAVTEVSLWGHRQQARASRQSGYLQGVLGTAEIIALSRQDADSLIAHVESQITEVLGIDGCRWIVGPDLDPGTPVLDHRGRVTRNGHPFDIDRNGLPTNDEVAVVVRQGDTTLGHFLLNSAVHATWPTREQLRVAVLLADQVGLVIERQGN